MQQEVLGHPAKDRRIILGKDKERHRQKVVWMDSIMLIPLGGRFPYERDRDACQEIEELKETNLGVAQALFEP